MHPETIYHYSSSMDFLWGLLVKKEMYATHKDFLNDPSELSGMISNLKTKIDSDFPALSTNDHFNNLIHDELTHINIFIISFSCLKDNLPLWLIYARGGGYSIGINTAYLSKSIKQTEEPISENNFSILKNDELSIAMGLCRYEKYRPLLGKNVLLESFFKHQAYKFESEFRIAILNPDASFPYSGKFIQLIADKIRLQIPFADDIDLNTLIDEIIISPFGNQGVIKNKIKKICQFADIDTQKIKVSDIPYQEA